jgi:hypothetical protein
MKRPRTHQTAAATLTPARPSYVHDALAYRERLRCLSMLLHSDPAPGYSCARTVGSIDDRISKPGSVRSRCAIKQRATTHLRKSVVRAGSMFRHLAAHSPTLPLPYRRHTHPIVQQHQWRSWRTRGTARPARCSGPRHAGSSFPLAGMTAAYPALGKRRSVATALVKSGAWIPATRIFGPDRHHSGPTPSWTRVTMQMNGTLVVTAATSDRRPVALRVVDRGERRRGSR